MKNLVIITGAPGTGKTYWTRLLTKEFPALCAFSYDDVKERFFDLYGFDNLEQKRENTARSLLAYYRELGVKMDMGEDLIIEYPFNMRHAPTIRALVDRYGYRAVTVYLFGQMDVIYARASARDKSATRHPGHLLSRYHKGVTMPPAGADAGVFMTRGEFADSCAKKNYDIRIGYNLPVDVTDFEKVDREDVFRQIEQNTSLRRAHGA